MVFYGRQSERSLYNRFFSNDVGLSKQDVDELTHVDYAERMALVALAAGEIIGIGMYERTGTLDSADVSFSVDDEQQRRGIATILLEHLAVAARDVGITAFTAQVLPLNQRMLRVLRQAGFEASSHYADGVMEVRLDIEPTEDAASRIEERARIADVRSVARLLGPESVAVIGAGRTAGSVGHEILRELVLGELGGPVYPVNRHARHVSGLRAYTSVLDVPDRVDLAIIAVPAHEVPAAVEDCARKRVQAVCVLAAAFAEAGENGVRAERALVEACRRSGMRLLGPASGGLVNTDRRVAMNAALTDAQALPAAGSVAVAAQSTALGAVILEHAADPDLGISSFVSLGDAADVSVNDLLRYWESDERTSVVLLQLRSFGNPRNFARVVRRVARSKAVVVMPPADETAVPLLDQLGGIRVDAIDELVDTAHVAVHQPLPGGRVAVVANASDAVKRGAASSVAAGLVLAELGPETAAALAQLPIGAERRNPVDCTERASDVAFEAALRAVLADGDVDVVVAAVAPSRILRADAAARAVTSAARAAHGKTVVASFFDGRPTRRSAPAAGAVPIFPFPERAIDAVARGVAYAAWRGEGEGSLPDLERFDGAAARDVVARALGRDPSGVALTHDEARSVLRAAGIEPVPSAVVWSVDEAADAAGALGFPVALKATGLGRLGKSEASGVALDLHGAHDVREGYGRMVERLGDAMRPAVLQQMVEPGADVLVALDQPRSAVPTIAVGIGGASADVVDEVAVRVLPLTDRDAERLVTAATAAGLLASAPGASDATPVRDLLLRLSALADEVPELAAVRLNPVIVSRVAAVTDVVVRVAPWPLEPPPVRRLTSVS